jgi:hypothetical protein
VRSRDGKYELDAWIGSGASSVVCRAHEVDLKREVALKLFPVRPNDATLPAVKREAQNLARVRHPNVVVVHATGDLELVPGGERCVYVAMELGTPLQTFLQGACLGTGSILALFCQVAEGLAAIHYEGLVHRDFKPGNVVLVKNVPKIVDFGLAVSVDADLGSTRSMRVVGTPAFMAPETLRGGQQDARSDQFSFAAALWHALCGELPYNGADLDPDARRVHERPSASPARPVAKVLRRALSPAPADRFTDMRALAAALQAVAEPVPAASATGETPTMDLDAYQTTEVAQRGRRARRSALWLLFPLVGALSVTGSLGLLGFWDTPGAEFGDTEGEAETHTEGEIVLAAPSSVATQDCPAPAALVGAWKFSAIAEWAENTSLVGKVGRYTIDLSADGTPCGLIVDLRKHGNDKREYSKVRSDRQRVEVMSVPGLTGGFAGRFIPTRPNDADDSFSYVFSFVVDGDQLYGDFHGMVNPGAQRYSGVLRGGRADSVVDAAGASPAGADRIPCFARCGARCLGADATAECRRACGADPWAESACPAPDPAEKVRLPPKMSDCVDAKQLAGRWLFVARDRKTREERAYDVDLRANGCDLTAISARERGRGEALVDGKGRADAAGRWDLTLTSGRGRSGRVQHTWSLVGRVPAFGEFTAYHDKKLLAGGVLAAYRRP